MHGCQGITEMLWQMRQGRVKGAGKIQAAAEEKCSTKGVGDGFANNRRCWRTTWN